MRLKELFLIAIGICWCGGSLLAGGRDQTDPERKAQKSLPPLPPGITELKFGDFFVTPIGDRGLTFTEKLRGLDGKRVRILGYMVRQEQGTPGFFLLTPLPAQTDEDHYGLADDLPATTLHVRVPKGRESAVGYTPGLLLLTGTLSIGPREEADGRISNVRLACELPEAIAAKRSLAPVGKGGQRMISRTD